MDDFGQLTPRYFDAIGQRRKFVKDNENDLFDFRSGIIASTIANCHRDPKRSKPLTPADFMLGELSKKPKKLSPLELSEKIKASFKAMGAKPERI